MEATLTISTRAVGRRRRLLDDWSLEPPAEFIDGGEPITLRVLLTRVVIDTVAAFERRQEAGKFVRVLSQRQIADQAVGGKIDPRARDLEQDVDVDQAVANALQSFEDGLYLVIIDDIEHRDLDAEVFLKPDSRLTFLRLVMLAGG